MIIGEITSSNISILVAFGGGIVSILSPCVLPMIPGYLSLVTGLTVTELQGGEHRHMVRIAHDDRACSRSGSPWCSPSSASPRPPSARPRSATRRRSTRVSGFIVFVDGARTSPARSCSIAPRLYPEARFQMSDRFGMFTAPIAGAAFAFGWSPCLGPVIAAVFGVAATQTGLRSVALLVAYSLGMGVSFLLVGLAFGRWATPLNFVKRHMKTLTLVVGRAPRGVRAAADVRPPVVAERAADELPRLARPRAASSSSADPHGSGAVRDRGRGVCQNRTPATAWSPA